MKAKQTLPASAPYPDYLRVYSVSKVPDDAHTVAMTDQSGVTWHLEVSPAFNLDDFEYPRCTLSDIHGEYMIALFIRDSRRSQWRAWLKGQLGKPIGLVVDNQLVRVAKVGTESDPTIAVRLGHNNLEAYTRVAEKIRAGGASLPESQPSTTRSRDGGTATRPSKSSP